MPIGGMRYRITIEQAAETRGASGGISRAWSALVAVWADVQFNRGREFFAARQLLAEKNAVIKIRYRSDVSSANRVVFNGQTYNIVDAVPEAGRKRYLFLYCSTGASPEGV
jgi:SPP1 family predicted phage head-tail adaptor